MADRKNYTYTPSYQPDGRGYTPPNARQAPPAARQQQVQQEPVRYQPRTVPPQGEGSMAAEGGARPIKDLAMLATILFGVPLIGIIAVFYQPFLWLFAVVCAVCFGVMWWKRCFVQGTRIMLSALLLVLALLSTLAAVSLQAPKEQGYPQYSGTNDTPQTFQDITTQQQTQEGTVFPGLTGADPEATAGIDLFGSAGDGTEGGTTGTDANQGTITNPFSAANQQSQESQGGGTDQGTGDANGVLAAALPTDAAPVNEAVSGAQTALENYLTCWKEKDYETMVNYTLPTWRAAQLSNGAQQQLYWNHNFWILKEWSMTSLTTSPAADSATFRLVTNMSKRNGAQTPVMMEYQATVVNDGTSWYVDPDSVRTGVTIEATAEPDYAGGSVVPTPVPPEPTIPPSTKLYRNSEGGKKYHAQEKCSSINEKYYSKMKSFSYSDLDKDDYKNLEPCSECDAPARNQ